MRTFSFEHIVRLQFNSFILIVIKNKLKSRHRQLARRSKREVLFREMAETKQVKRGTNDTSLYDCISFKVLHFTIYVVAGYLHDISAIYPNNQRVRIACQYGIPLTKKEIEFPMIIHQKISKCIAMDEFGIEDEAILSAIECHTTLKKKTIHH